LVVDSDICRAHLVWRLRSRLVHTVFVTRVQIAHHLLLLVHLCIIGVLRLVIIRFGRPALIQILLLEVLLVALATLLLLEMLLVLLHRKVI